jgi:LAO/AO transport system kinase
MSAEDEALRATCAAVLSGQRRALGRLVSAFEDRRDVGVARRLTLMQVLDEAGVGDAGLVTGITGPPGVGKSSLVSTLVNALLSSSDDTRICVVAVDPSSTRSGGSLLGDRTRLDVPGFEQRWYFRSQPSGGALGGLGPATHDVVRLLRRLYDHVLVETVGVGQSELEVLTVADWTWLVLQPLTGDSVQFLKAGIMEAPDLVVLNKSDETRAAARTWHSLRAALKLARASDETTAPLVRASALTGLGVDELVARLQARRAEVNERSSTRDAALLLRWVKTEWGRRGVEALGGDTGVTALLAQSAGYDAAQLQILSRLA